MKRAEQLLMGSPTEKCHRATDCIVLLLKVPLCFLSYNNHIQLSYCLKMICHWKIISLCRCEIATITWFFSIHNHSKHWYQQAVFYLRLCPGQEPGCHILGNYIGSVANFLCWAEDSLKTQQDSNNVNVLFQEITYERR